MNGELTARERQILDMWPRFEDGEPVMVGDESTNNKNQRFTVKRIEFRHGKWMLNDSVTEGHYLNGKPGECVKRPATKVLDADGVEVHDGDTVYELETGEEYKVERVFSGAPDPDFPDHTIRCNKVADPITHVFKPDQLTHRHIVLDADGVEIEVGDRIYSIETGNSYTVRSINGSGTIEFNGFNDKGWSPKYFMHMQPTIDADGVLIKVGDTVWHHSGFAHGVVTSIDAGSLMGTVRYVNGGVEFRDAAKDLTHACPDSWERLEEDAVKVVCEYAGAVPTAFGAHDCDTCRFYGEHGKLICEQLMALDILRRAKKLAGVE